MSSSSPVSNGHPVPPTISGAINSAVDFIGDHIDAARERRSEGEATSTAVVPAQQGSVGGIQLSGVTIHGLDPDNLNFHDAKLMVRIPLVRGKYVIPAATAGSKADVKLNLEEGAEIEVNSSIMRNDADDIVLENASMTARGIRIKNPASAFEPSNSGWGFWDSIVDGVKDSAADYLLTGGSVADDGSVQVSGHIDAYMFSGDKEQTVGTVDRTLRAHKQTSVAMASDSTPAANVESKTESGSDPASMIDVALLQRAGAMTDQATFQMQAKSDATKLEAEANGVRISSQSAPIQVMVEGTASINLDGTLKLNITEASTPTVTTGAGTANVTGVIDIDSFSATPEARGDLQFSGKLNNLHGIAAPWPGIQMPLHLQGTDQIDIRGTTGVTLRQGVTLAKGHAYSVMHNKLNDGELLKMGNVEVALNDGHVNTEIDTQFDFDGTHVNVTGGLVKGNVVGTDADVSLGRFKLRVDGEFEAAVDTKKIAYSTASNALAAEGKFSYKIDPRMVGERATAEFGAFSRDVDFTITNDGKMQVDPGPSGLSEFFAPIFRINGHPERIVDPTGPGAGEIGSTTFRERIEELTNAVTTTGNSARLLIDGVMSFPERMRIIENAKHSICMQTLIFKNDVTGGKIADGLIAAAKRGVDVRVIIDSLGNIEGLDDLLEEQPLYKKLQEGGVQLSLYNDPAARGFGELIQAIADEPELLEMDSVDDLKVCMKPDVMFKLCQAMMRIRDAAAPGRQSTLARLRSAGEKIFTSALRGEDDLFSISSGALLQSAIDPIFVAKLAAEMNHRWHEKYLVADGQEAVIGGINTADEYLRGGEVDADGQPFRASSFGVEREAWRDTDVALAGHAARDILSNFKRNWQAINSSWGMSEPPAIEAMSGDESKTSGANVQIIQHRPRLDGDHNITNFMIESLKAMKSGQKALFANSYFVPTGALTKFKEALMDAAQRGVDVRVVTNGVTTTDAPQVNQVATFAYREMLAAGVKIFERIGDRTMHSKFASFAGNTAAIGSWNADNRSASLNSEGLAVVYDEDVGRQAEEAILNDMSAEVAKEVTLEQVNALPWRDEAENMAVSVAAPLM